MAKGLDIEEPVEITTPFWDWLNKGLGIAGTIIVLIILMAMLWLGVQMMFA